MATLKEKRQAREWALREVVELLGSVLHGQTITFAHEGNQFASESHRRLVTREIESIRWQLQRRHSKLLSQLGL